MPMQTLDSSHRCVLENLASLQRAQRCLAETEDYLWSVLTEIRAVVAVPRGLTVEWEQDRRNFYLQAKTVPLGPDSKRHWLAVGLENLSVPAVVSAEASPGCRAYVFSPVLDVPGDPLADSAVVRALDTLPTPAGFAAPAVAQAGYLFVRPLERISVNTFCSRPELTDHFRAPLNELLAWLASVGPQLPSSSATPAAK
jgi:hypothetical protein